MEDGLKISSFIEFPSAGYDGEEVDSERNTPFAPEGEGSWHEFTSWYSYRDSQVGNNANSTRVVVTIRQEYMYQKASGNHYTIQTKGYLTKIVRDDKRGTVNCCSSRSPGRTIQVAGVKGNVITGQGLVFGPKETNTAAQETIFSGNAYLGENQYDLGPGESTPLRDLIVDYLSYTPGYWNGSEPSDYADHMRMGLMFWNDLPKECDPPLLMGVSQTDDICENEVEACLRFAPCTCEGMALVFEYHFDGEDWAAAQAKGQTYQMDASASSSNIICLPHLPPTNHTWAPVHLYWRAKYIPVTSDMPETKWVEDSFEIIFILAPHETVPDISVEECSMLKRGDLIDKYQQEVCYNDYSCADMEVKNPSRDADVEECKKVNGVKS